MKMLLIKPFRQLALAVLTLTLLLGAPASAYSCKPVKEPALSPRATDLAALVTQGQAVDAEVAGLNLTAENSCTELGGASTSVADWLAAMQGVYDGLGSAFSVDVESLDALDQLSNLNLSIANNLELQSRDLNTLSTSVDLVEYDASLAAMLSLSDDIGSMGNRIGEMADRILVMADNIGLMADRILITQQLQATNVVATQNSILATQLNAIALSDSISTLVYDPALASLQSQANALGFSMDLVSLNQLNMAFELARIESEVALYQAQVMSMYNIITQDSAVASQFTNGGTLTMLGDLSLINRGLAASLDSYADSINQLAPSTSTSTLGSSVDSMLRLVRDIGIMSDRIVEMSDRIIVMADNIGLMSARIVETQNLQQTNIEFTEASLNTASSTTINVIAANGL
jgi:hypothetical protein